MYFRSYRQYEAGKKEFYVLIAPAFTGQFGEKATPGRLRTAFKAIGFKGMVEVAVFADILTLKEALEFEPACTEKRGLSVDKLLLSGLDSHDQKNLL